MSKKRSVATHTSYMSCCTFLRSENLVSLLLHSTASSVSYRFSSQILTGSGDATCAIWDVESGHMIQNFHGHTADVLAVDIPKGDTSNIFISGVCLSTKKFDCHLL